MGESQLENIVNILSAIGKLESTLGELYAECARKYPEEIGFWEGLSQEEIKHAEDISRAASIFSQNSSIFRQTGPYNTTVLDNVTRYVKDIQAKLTQGNMSKKDLLVIVRDIEQSVLETKGLDFLKTDHVEYMAILKRIADDTMRHKKRLSERITKA
jgi:hypothetical protein